MCADCTRVFTFSFVFIPEQSLGRLRAGLFQEIARQNLKREVVVSAADFFVVADIIAITDYCATLPSLICRRLVSDPRLKVLSPPVDLGHFQSRWLGMYGTVTMLRIAGSDH